MSDGNVQDISVHDKNNASLAATQEAQDMSNLERVVVPMPQFVDPHNPLTNAGSINLALDAHPVEHSADYAEGVDSAVVASPQDSAGMILDAKPDSEWTKDDYKDALKNAGLAVSGNKEELQGRWDAYTAAQAEYALYTATNWFDDIDQTESSEDLATLRAAYEASGADDSEVVDAFDAKQTELEG